jgi:RNA recognition motif-containing protein
MERPGEVRLLVRGIAKGVAVTELATLFAPFGADPERIALPRDRRTRRRKGIAYVFVPSAQQAADAIRALDNTTFGEKTITLEPAAERPPKKRRFGPPPGQPQQQAPKPQPPRQPQQTVAGARRVWDPGPPRPGLAPRPGTRPPR